MKRKLLACIAFGAAGFLGLSPFSATAQDATKAQPESYRVIFHNSSVRVLEYNGMPGMGVCGSGVHSHPAHLTILLSSARVKIRQNGSTSIHTNKIGDVFWSEAVTHETENVGDANVRSLIVELKAPVHGR